MILDSCNAVISTVIKVSLDSIGKVWDDSDQFDRRMYDHCIKCFKTRGLTSNVGDTRDKFITLSNFHEYAGVFGIPPLSFKGLIQKSCNSFK